MAKGGSRPPLSLFLLFLFVVPVLGFVFLFAVFWFFRLGFFLRLFFGLGFFRGRFFLGSLRLFFLCWSGLWFFYDSWSLGGFFSLFDLGGLFWLFAGIRVRGYRLSCCDLDAFGWCSHFCCGSFLFFLGCLRRFGDASAADLYWRRRQWRRVRLEEFRNLGLIAQLAVEHHQEHFLQQTFIDRQLGGDAHLGHGLIRQLLARERPLGQEVFQLLRCCLILGGEVEKEHRLRLAVHQQRPGLGRSARFFAQQMLQQIFGVMLQRLPLFYEAGTRHQLLNGSGVFILQLGRQEIHVGRRRIGNESEIIHLAAGFRNLMQAGDIGLSARP